jgi:hypothetical protein
MSCDPWLIALKIADLLMSKLLSFSRARKGHSRNFRTSNSSGNSIEIASADKNLMFDRAIT